MRTFSMTDPSGFLYQMEKIWRSLYTKLTIKSKAKLGRIYCYDSATQFLKDHVICNISLSFDSQNDFKNLWKFPNYLLLNENFNFSLKNLLINFIKSSRFDKNSYLLLTSKIFQIAMEVDRSIIHSFNFLAKNIQKEIQKYSS